MLVDRGTASSSEIVAGAIKDRGRGKVVGTRTFGKGVFQELMPLSNGGVLDLTVGEYFLPSGENIGNKGVRPNVRAVDDPETERDEALPTGPWPASARRPAPRRGCRRAWCRAGSR